jgi:spectinomycin phosphotransferase
MHIVDWDETLLAPIERDLMFIDGAANREKDLFYRGYGETEVDPLALAFYRYEWVVQEFGDYGERVFLTADTGEATKEDAVREFVALFAPGDVVEAAYRSDMLS